MCSSQIYTWHTYDLEEHVYVDAKFSRGRLWWLAKLKVGYNLSENEMKSLNIRLLQTLLVKKQNLNEQMK